MPDYVDLIEQITKSNVLKKDSRAAVLDLLDNAEMFGFDFDLKNTKAFRNYMNRDEQNKYAQLRAFSVLCGSLARKELAAGYERLGAHLDVACRFVAKAIVERLECLDLKERRAVERSYKNTEIFVCGTDEVRGDPERQDDQYCEVGIRNLYLLAEWAVEAKCKGCGGKEKCDYRDVMVDLRIPGSGNSDVCPYCD